MKNVGIWIDSREASIIILEGGKITVKSVLSGTSRKEIVIGETSKKKVRGGIGFDFSSAQESRHREELKKYYRVVNDTIIDSDNLYLFGPGSAKLSLEKEMKKLGEIASRILKVETSDILTRNQKIAHVREFFSARGLVKSARVRKSRKTKIKPS